MTREDNIAAQERFRAAVNSGDLDAFDALVAPAAVDHDPGPGQVPGPAGYRALFGELRTAFPDLHIEVAHLVADDDTVAIAYDVTGTHQGALLGHPATGRPVTFRGVQVSRFADGLLVERWGSSDQLGMLQPLGLAPEP